MTVTYFYISIDNRKGLRPFYTGLRKVVRPEAFLNLPIPLPDLATQQAIADFLDRETARIDQLIEKKQRLVQLLEERKHSAVEWAITIEGKQTKLGHHISVLPGYAFSSTQFTAESEDIRLLRGANVSPAKLRWDDVVYWPLAEAAAFKRYLLEPGDIVLGMDRPWISSGIRVAELSEADCPSLLLQRVCKISPKPTLDKNFLKLLLRSRLFLGYFEPILTGVSVPHISEAQICGFRFPYIAPVEQQARARLCAREVEHCDQLGGKVIASIERLREYRSALITAAVTGQIDVSGLPQAGSQGVDATLAAEE